MCGIKKSFIFLLTGFRPRLGPARCCYALGCTQFAVLQLETAPLLIACKMIMLRLLSCNPLTVFYRDIRCLKNKR